MFIYRCSNNKFKVNLRGTSGSCVTSSSRESTEQKYHYRMPQRTQKLYVGELRGHKNVSQKVLKKCPKVLDIKLIINLKNLWNLDDQKRNTKLT